MFGENDPSRVILDQPDQIEALVECLEEVITSLRNDARHVEADKILHAIRDQRFQAMLVRGQVMTWG
jgi:phosphoglycerate-specific signal transduction histidine kinase